jgi:polyphosphate kinase
VPTTVAAEANDSPFLDRDLSWLEFNRRVLHEALDDRTPLGDLFFRVSGE